MNVDEIISECNKLKKHLRTTDLNNQNSNIFRNKLQNYLIRSIQNDVVKADNIDAIKDIWKICVYSKIKHFQILIKKNKVNNINEYTKYLNKSKNTFLTILNGLLKMNQIIVKENTLIDNFNPKVKDLSTIEMVSAIHISYKLLIYLGDIERYLSLNKSNVMERDWSKSAMYYSLACQLIPSFGNAHNQLALLSIYNHNIISAIYQYVRSISVSNTPFTNSRENLKRFLLKNRDLLQTSYINSGISNFIEYFENIKTHNSLFQSIAYIFYLLLHLNNKEIIGLELSSFELIQKPVVTRIKLLLLSEKNTKDKKNISNILFQILITSIFIINDSITKNKHPTISSMLICSIYWTVKVVTEIITTIIRSKSLEFLVLISTFSDYLMSILRDHNKYHIRNFLFLDSNQDGIYKYLSPIRRRLWMYLITMINSIDKYFNQLNIGQYIIPHRPLFEERELSGFSILQNLYSEEYSELIHFLDKRRNSFLKYTKNKLNETGIAEYKVNNYIRANKIRKILSVLSENYKFIKYDKSRSIYILDFSIEDDYIRIETNEESRKYDKEDVKKEKESDLDNKTDKEINKMVYPTNIQVDYSKEIDDYMITEYIINSKNEIGINLSSLVSDTIESSLENIKVKIENEKGEVNKTKNKEQLNKKETKTPLKKVENKKVLNDINNNLNKKDNNNKDKKIIKKRDKKCTHQTVLNTDRKNNLIQNKDKYFNHNTSSPSITLQKETYITSPFNNNKFENNINNNHESLKSPSSKCPSALMTFPSNLNKFQNNVNQTKLITNENFKPDSGEFPEIFLKRLITHKESYNSDSVIINNELKSSDSKNIKFEDPIELKKGLMKVGYSKEKAEKKTDSIVHTLENMTLKDFKHIENATEEFSPFFEAEKKAVRKSFEITRELNAFKSENFNKMMKSQLEIRKMTRILESSTDKKVIKNARVKLEHYKKKEKSLNESVRHLFTEEKMALNEQDRAAYLSFKEREKVYHDKMNIHMINSDRFKRLAFMDMNNLEFGERTAQRVVVAVPEDGKVKYHAVVKDHKYGFVPTAPEVTNKKEKNKKDK